MHSSKAYGYVLKGERLLVMEHPDHPEAGVQVPGGTVEPGETPRQAVLREVREETGLDGVEVVALVGTADFHMGDFGRDELQSRHFFWLRCVEETPESWIGHEESHGAPIRLRFRWVPLGQGLDLIAGHGALLPELASACRRT